MAAVITKRQRGFAKRYAESIGRHNPAPSPTAVYAQIAPHADVSYGPTLLDNPIVGQLIAAEVLRLNTPQAFAADLRHLRKAKRGVYHDGDKIADEPDWTARHNGLTLMLRALNITSDAMIDARAVNFNVGSLTPSQVQSIADTLTKLNAALALPDKV